MKAFTSHPQTALTAHKWTKAAFKIRSHNQGTIQSRGVIKGVRVF